MIIINDNDIIKTAISLLILDIYFATCQLNPSANSYQNRQRHLLHIYCFTSLLKKAIVS